MEVTRSFKEIIEAHKRPLDRGELEKITMLNSKLTELEIEPIFRIEQLPISEIKKDLKYRKAMLTYSELSPEFLKLSNEIEVETGVYEQGHPRNKKEKVRIPRFGLYDLNNPNMSVCFGYDPSFGEYFFTIIEPKVPKCIARQFALTCEIFSKSNSIDTYKSTNGYRTQGGWFLDWICDFPKEISQKYRKNLGKSLSFINTFHAIIPQETKEKIMEAQKTFGENIYIVADTKPEDWSQAAVKRYVSDPLIIGTIEDKCFFIDLFDTTPLERYVSKEFKI